jgi:hypothetical protein
MAQHGYLREYDEGWDRDEDRDRERDWRSERDIRDRDRAAMFRGEDRDRDWVRDRDVSYGQGYLSRERRDYGADWERSPSRFSTSQDDHYRSWRDRQVEALDRDYTEYCREREQQFHEDFDSWRRNRRANPQPLQTGMTESAQSQEQPTEPLELTKETRADPMSAATLGTTSDKTGGRRG